MSMSYITACMGCLLFPYIVMPYASWSIHVYMPRDAFYYCIAISQVYDSLFAHIHGWSSIPKQRCCRPLLYSSEAMRVTLCSCKARSHASYIITSCFMHHVSFCLVLLTIHVCFDYIYCPSFLFISRMSCSQEYTLFTTACIFIHIPLCWDSNL